MVSQGQGVSCQRVLGQQLCCKWCKWRTGRIEESSETGMWGGCGIWWSAGVGLWGLWAGMWDVGCPSGVGVDWGAEGSLGMVAGWDGALGGIG